MIVNINRQFVPSNIPENTLRPSPGRTGNHGLHVNSAKETRHKSLFCKEQKGTSWGVFPDKSRDQAVLFSGWSVLGEMGRGFSGLFFAEGSG